MGPWRPEGLGSGHVVLGLQGPKNSALEELSTEVNGKVIRLLKGFRAAKALGGSLKCRFLGLHRDSNLVDPGWGFSGGF